MVRRIVAVLIGILSIVCVGSSALAATLATPVAPAAGTKDATPPSDVATLSATTADHTVMLTWSAATDETGVTGYKVYYGTDEVKSGNTATYTKNIDAKNPDRKVLVYLF